MTLVEISFGYALSLHLDTYKQRFRPLFWNLLLIICSPPSFILKNPTYPCRIFFLPRHLRKGHFFSASGNKEAIGQGGGIEALVGLLKDGTLAPGVMGGVGTSIYPGGSHQAATKYIKTWF